MIRFAAPELTYRADRRRDGGEFQQRLARSWPLRCSLRQIRLKTTRRGRGRWSDASRARSLNLRRPCPDPVLRSLNTPEAARGPRPSCLRFLQRRPRTNKKRRRELRLGGAPIRFRRLLFRSTNSRVFRLIFVVLEIDQPAVRDRGDVRRGLPGYSCFAGCRPSNRNKSVIVTVRPHNDLAGGGGRRSGHQSGSRGCDER